jgi:16S rRNA (uracil1498-N3)-methyltransferase
MRTTRFFCDNINPDTAAVISDAQFRHLTKVLRLSIGDSVELFDGNGTIAQAVIGKIEKNIASLTIKDIKSYPKPQKNRIIIASSIAKGERFEMLVAKCTELFLSFSKELLSNRFSSSGSIQSLSNRQNSAKGYFCL